MYRENAPPQEENIQIQKVPFTYALKIISTNMLYKISKSVLFWLLFIAVPIELGISYSNGWSTLCLIWSAITDIALIGSVQLIKRINEALE